jgi:hypothetical protein
MARAARIIGEGGVIGWMLPETIQYPDDQDPLLAYTTVAYRVSQSNLDGSVNLIWRTNMTAAEVRNACKDAIRLDIIDRLGITIPRAQIKMLNSPE